MRGGHPLAQYQHQHPTDAAAAAAAAAALTCRLNGHTSAPPHPFQQITHPSQQITRPSQHIKHLHHHALHSRSCTHLSRSPTHLSRSRAHLSMSSTCTIMPFSADHAPAHGAPPNAPPASGGHCAEANQGTPVNCTGH